MARERTPEGKRVVIPVRVSEPKRDAIDAARGDITRSVWVERAIDAYLAAAGRKPPRRETAGIHCGGLPASSVPPPPEVPTGAVTGPERKTAPCPHRLSVGAYCKTCGRTKT